MEKFFNSVSVIVDFLHEPVGWVSAFAGFCIVKLLMVFLNDASSINQKVWLRITQIALFGCGLCVAYLWLFKRQELRDLLILVTLVMVLTAALSIATKYAVGPSIDVIKSHLTRRSKLERNRRTDSRNMTAHLPGKRDAFDPARRTKAGRVFIGLDERKREVVCPLPMQNIAVIGTTGAGKGVLLSSLAVQCARAGEFVFFGDPKTDDWAPHVLFAQCHEAGLPYVFLDLQPEAPHQTNILAGASAEEIEELLSVAFSLDDSGNPGSDFYRPADRDAAAYVARRATEGMTIALLYQECGDHLHDTAENFARRLKELAAMRSVNAIGGVSLASMMQTGGVVYCRGSMRNPKVKLLQRMLLVRLLQLAERRSTVGDEPRQVFTVLDEVRAWLSRPMVEFLSTARSKRVHVALAAQSLADIRDCPSDMNPDSVVGAVVENCPLKAFYRVQDPTTAAWVAEQTGTILVDDEVRSFESNALLIERVSKTRSVRQAERCQFDMNQLLNLPPSWAVVRGAGETRLVQICPMRADRNPIAITSEAYDGDVLIEAEAAI